jgi:D-glycero-D-manno-heptose 1,7-bisphosphate phosphatase
VEMRSNRTGEKTVPVLYLDLDGTVRKGKDELGHFVNKASDVEVFPEVPKLLRGYKRQGWRIIGVSNQGGIALGYLTLKDCGELMAETQRQCAGLFDKITWCSHHPDANEPEMAVCWCRKPRPGMIIESALALSEVTREIYPPHLAVMVGDMDTDRRVRRERRADVPRRRRVAQGGSISPVTCGTTHENRRGNPDCTNAEKALFGNRAEIKLELDTDTGEVAIDAPAMFVDPVVDFR